MAKLEPQDSEVMLNYLDDLLAALRTGRYELLHWSFLEKRRMRGGADPVGLVSYRPTGVRDIEIEVSVAERGGVGDVP